MVDQIRFFATAARHLEGKSAGRVHGRPHVVHPARADRRVRPGRPVELPDDDGGLEVRPGDRGRQHRRAQAERHDAGEHDAARRDRRRVPAARRVQRRSAATATPGGRWSTTPMPAMVSITGSVRAGMEVAGAAAADLKRVHLELGGKAPVIVFDDADVDGRGRGHLHRRLLQRRPGLHGGDPRARRAGRLRRLRRRPRRGGQGARGPGLPDDEDVLYGPVNNADQLDRVGGFVDRAPGPRPASLAGGGRQGDDRVLLRADRRRRPAPGRRDGPGRDLRPGHHGAALQRRGRGACAGRTASSTAWRRACGRRTSAGRCGWPSASTSAACGSTPTSRSSPRCPTAASSAPATARTSRQYGFEDYTRIKHVMANIDS